MVNVRIPPGANCLLATKLQTDSTGYTLESVIHIGYDSLTITTIHPKDSLLWRDFSHRGFFVMFHSLYAAVSLGFLSYLPSSMGKHIKLCPLGKGDEVLCAQHSLHPVPFPVLQKYASHRPSRTHNPFRTHPQDLMH